MSLRLLRKFSAIQAPRPTLCVTTRPSNLQTAWKAPLFLNTTRTYAKKSKDTKKKSNKDDSKVIAREDEEEFVPQFDEKDIQARYDNSLTSLKEHLANMRMGRANPCEYFFSFKKIIISYDTLADFIFLISFVG